MSWVEVQVEVIVFIHRYAVVQRDSPQRSHPFLQLSWKDLSARVLRPDVRMRSAAVVAVRDVPLRIADVEETALLQADVVDAEWLADPFVHRVGELAECGQRGRSAVVIVRVVATHGAREGVVRTWRQRFEARDS